MTPLHSVLLGDGSESTGELRELAAGLILSNPHKYTSALLGRSNTEYVEWLLRDESWGGECVVCMQVKTVTDYTLTLTVPLPANTTSSVCDTVACFTGAIELSVFSEHYKVELDVVDVQSQRIDRFGTQTISSVLTVTMYNVACIRPMVWHELLYSSKIRH